MASANPITRFFAFRVRLWPLLLAAVLIAGGLVGAFTSGALNALALPTLFGGNTVRESSEVVRFVVPEQQVVLASVHIEGFEKEGTDGNILGVPVPASGRNTYIAYKFNAKLGFEGSDVKIDPIEGKENTYRVSIPQFIVIGNNKIKFEAPIESNEVLGWLADKANQTEMTNRILSERNAAKYIENSKEVLTAQARLFYTSIIRSVSPDAEIEFVFADGIESGDKND
jgi:hypothetical protein